MDNKDEEYDKLFMNLYDESKGIPDLIYKDFYYKKILFFFKLKNPSFKEGVYKDMLFY